MNPIEEKHAMGKVGELLVQIRLLSMGIQAAPPIFDSGNDLIAVKDEVFKAIQVKTKLFQTERWRFDLRGKKYHLLALVSLGENPTDLDKAKIFLLTQREVGKKQSARYSEFMEEHAIDRVVITHFLDS